MNNDVASLIFLVSVQFFSLICGLYVLNQGRKARSPLRNLPNHLIICLLIVSTWTITFDLLSTEFYYWNNLVPIQTDWACRLYNVSFFTMSGLNRMFMAFMSIERHVLVFNAQLYRSRRSRYMLHYFPIIILILWSFTYSFVTDVLITCPQIHFRYTRFLCGYTCSILSQNLAMIYIWFQVFLPTIITIIACILLPIRFILKKRNLQRLQWGRARKMIVQMSVIATTYTICWLPYMITIQLVSVNRVSLSDNTVLRFMIFDPYVVSLLTPFICLHTTSDWLKLDTIRRIIRRCFPRQRNVIHPRTTLLTLNKTPITNPEGFSSIMKANFELSYMIRGYHGLLFHDPTQTEHSQIES